MEAKMDSFSLQNAILCSPALRKQNWKKYFVVGADAVEKLLMDLNRTRH